MKEYKVAHRGLAEGTHSFEFEMNDEFFDCFDETRGTNGSVKAEVEIVKSASLMVVKMRIDGVVKAICDRCLEEMDLPVRGEMNLFVKQGGDDEESGDADFILLAPEDDYLDLSKPLYELYVLTLPMRVTHPEGECNSEMERILQTYTEEKSEEIDPRWEKLKELINNNK